MALEITVGPPQIVINQGETVWAADPDGQLVVDSRKGLMFRDTRLISGWRLYTNGSPWELLNGAATTHYASRVHLTNRPIATQDGDVASRTLTLLLGRWLEGGVHEDIDITNHGLKPLCFNLELRMRADFADLFEVKSGRLVRRGRITTEWSQARQTLRTAYVNADFSRAIVLRPRCTPHAVYANGRLSFEVALAPGATWHACLLYDLQDGGQHLPAPTACIDASDGSHTAQELDRWRARVLKMKTPHNEEFYRLYARAVDDMAALRIPVGAEGETVALPAAGLPWFVALFGRDSLVASMQTAPVTIEFARGALAKLGEMQARERDDYRDAEPGKIPHELRLGELAHFKLVPHTPYYGTADATPLYLLVLHEAWRWTGERALVERHLETAERCLSWIDESGDRDGDGFQEYEKRAPTGYENMGWKDSGDAVLYPDGGRVNGPKALCELQGYVYAAWLGMAEIFEALGRPERAAALRQKAASLFTRFNEVFWDEAWGGYAYALDGDKRPVLTSVSNVGHCLWSGIVRPDRAARVVQRLMAPDMFSGWGVRTLSARHPAFNPLSYHNGSVWPHDNGLIALGFKRYGFVAETTRLARAMSDAASYFAMHQVPELFAGIARDGTSFPVQCPGANVPQAWAAGAAFSLLRAILGLEADAPAGSLYVDPALPAWLPKLTLTGLHVGSQVFTLRFAREENGDTEFEVLKGSPTAVRRGTRAAAKQASG
jgi:glycogen debranching enzyme